MIRATGEIESVCPRPLTRWVKKVSGPVSLDFCAGTSGKFSVCRGLGWMRSLNRVGGTRAEWWGFYAAISRLSRESCVETLGWIEETCQNGRSDECLFLTQTNP
jgi:hypothetical protein